MRRVWYFGGRFVGININPWIEWSVTRPRRYKTHKARKFYGLSCGPIGIAWGKL